VKTENTMNIDTRKSTKEIEDEISEYYRKLEHNDLVARSLGGESWKWIVEVLDHANIIGEFEIVDEPSGEDQFEKCGIFTKIFVSQGSVGDSGDSFEGTIYCKWLHKKWLAIPYSC
jgi:hypothetical protein